MGEFDAISLKPMSWNILLYMRDKEPQKSEDIAEALNIKVRACDASITKALVRYGFIIREAKLTRVLKKDYNLIKITDKGKRYVDSKIS